MIVGPAPGVFGLDVRPAPPSTLLAASFTLTTASTFSIPPYVFAASPLGPLMLPLGVPDLDLAPRTAPTP